MTQGGDKSAVAPSAASGVSALIEFATVEDFIAAAWGSPLSDHGPPEKWRALLPKVKGSSFGEKTRDFLHRLGLMLPARRATRSTETVVTWGGWILRCCAALLAATPERRKASFEANHLAAAVSKAWGAQGSQQAIKTAMLAAANLLECPSNRVAHLAAASGADYFSCLYASATVSSGEHEAGLADAVETLLLQCDKRPAARVLARRLEQAESILGFTADQNSSTADHANLVLALPTKAAHQRRHEVVTSVIDAASQQKLGVPDLAFSLAALVYEYRWPPGSAHALFVFSRLIGATTQILATWRPRS